MTLKVDLNLADPNGFYEQLVEMQRGLSDEQSRMVNAKLILLMANHIGDADVLKEAMAAARSGVEQNPGAEG